MSTAADISNRIIDAILSKQLEPGMRLGEQEFATLFECSRTIVREAMVELSARGIVTVSPRRGWYMTDVTTEMAREIYDAREIIETGLLASFARRGRVLDQSALDRLRAHLAAQEVSLGKSDVGRRSYLLGDFHVCLAECLGNRILAARLRDLTVLTTLYTARHQTFSDAWRSYEEHVAVIDALADGDAAAAAERMRDHLGTWEEKVNNQQEYRDPLAGLRRALTPPPGLPRRETNGPDAGWKTGTGGEA